jgi:hypothetical protein
LGRKLEICGRKFLVKSKLTQEQIDRGIRESSGSCPIAQFFRDELGSSKVDVDIDGGNQLRIVVGEHYVHVEKPEKLIDFIIKYDNGKIVKPMFIEYEVMG